MTNDRKNGLSRRHSVSRCSTVRSEIASTSDCFRRILIQIFYERGASGNHEHPNDLNSVEGPAPFLVQKVRRSAGNSCDESAADGQPKL